MFVHDIILRILPTLFIVPMNIYMFIKIRDIAHKSKSAKIQINATLLLIVLTHMILTIPFNIMIIIVSSPINTHVDDVYFNNTFYTAFSITYIMKIFSHAINHFLYCFTNLEIREETIKAFSFTCCKSKRLINQ